MISSSGFFILLAIAFGSAYALSDNYRSLVTRFEGFNILSLALLFFLSAVTFLGRIDTLW